MKRGLESSGLVRMTASDNSSDPKASRASGFKRALLWVALACCLQFVVFGLVGVIRGFSVQSWIPSWVFLAGFALSIPLSLKNKVASVLFPIFLILFALAGMSQGKHQKRAEALQEEGKHEEAIVEFRKEIDIWHHRIRFNPHEAASLFGIATSHAQLERFEEAREIYLEMTRKCRGYYRDRAEEERLALDAGLEKLRGSDKLLAEAADDEQRASLLFDLAIVYRGLNCTGKAIEQYETIQTLEVREARKEQAQRFAEKLR